MNDTETRTPLSAESVQWLTVALVAAHFVFGIATEVTGSEILRVLSLAAAGLAVLGALFGMYRVYVDRNGRPW